MRTIRSETILFSLILWLSISTQVSLAAMVNSTRYVTLSCFNTAGLADKPKQCTRNDLNVVVNFKPGK